MLNKLMSLWATLLALVGLNPDMVSARNFSDNKKGRNIMKNNNRRLASFAMAFILVVSIFSGVMSAPAYAAAAGETKELVADTIFYIGDTIMLTSKTYINTDDENKNTVFSFENSNSYTVQAPYYNENWNQFVFSSIFNDNMCYLALGSGKELTGTETITGIKCVSGDGTQAKPYKFELVFAGSTNASVYTLTIPETLTVADKGWNALDGGIQITDGSNFPAGKTLTLTATSTNGWALKTNPDNGSSVSYTLKAAETDTEETTSWTFTEAQVNDGQTINAGIDVEDYSNKPAGSYTDSVTFTAHVDGGSGNATGYTLLSAATTADIGKVVCAAGHLHTAKTAVPDGCTAVGILGKVTGTGHGLILALQNAESTNYNTINGWSSETAYAGTTLKVLPDDTARDELTSYTMLGSTNVSNWAVAQKSDYETIFTNLGSTTGNEKGKTFDTNVNAYITTGVGGSNILTIWSATAYDSDLSYKANNSCWYEASNTTNGAVRPVLGF